MNKKNIKNLIGRTKKISDGILALWWVFILVLAFYLARYYINLIVDVQEQYKLWANFYMMIVTISVALVIYYLTETLKKNKS